MGSAQSMSDGWADFIVHLTAATFEKALSDNSSFLVLFYAPYNENLKDLQSMLSEAAKQMKNENVSLKEIFLQIFL
jgi:thioredoxin-like negative regulator of GroEL